MNIKLQKNRYYSESKLQDYLDDKEKFIKDFFTSLKIISEISNITYKLNEFETLEISYMIESCSITTFLKLHK